CDIIEYSWVVSGHGEIDNPVIGMSPQVLEMSNNLREFLFERVYKLRSAQPGVEKAIEVLRLLFKYFTKHEEQLPLEYSLCSDEIERRVVDYIAGMTDHYALRMAEELSLVKTK
ncbi:MAG: deoxyguanosinetriphosphate triphosphohydrolase, partial [Dehalococcoidales bacterium]|nr:deoxyguanosinetriphosphate triphosphohydrolase [Dehalococcoidales bacterium]